MRPTHLVPSLAVAMALAACSGEPASAPASADTAAAAPASASAHSFSPELSKDDFAEMVKTLSSDEFEGRAPGAPGGEKTVEYIKAQYERIGLEPGGENGTFFQTVPMVETTADESTVLRLDVAGKQSELAFGTDMVIGTRTGEAEIKVADSDLVFVGYGVDAPELGWNDYAGLDVKGKTVVMLVNDPGFHAKDASLFEGERMTYYGRWTYKFEEAARKGAAAALIIHDTAGAAYGWDVVKNSWSGPQFDLRASDDPEPRLPAQGWLTGEAAKQLFADAGQDLDALYVAANQRGFKAVPLDARVSFDLDSTSRESSSRNVVGILRGSEAPDEAVVYMGHWDHLGKHEGEGDTIYNGAVDNATGIAGIIEIAEKFKADGPPKRSVAFIAVTLEESGLLGSKYQVAHPAFPLEKTVGVVNLDAMSVAGPARDMVVTGLGNSQLEDILKTYTDAQGRTLVMEGNPAGGFYFRSDHFNYAKAGVPALYAKGGDDLVEGGKEAGAAYAKRYTDVAYHKPADEFDPAWNLDGVIQDLEALYGVGRTLADDGGWPNWYEGNAFKAARDGMRAAK
ncbi:M28 family metallopeptidase [Luteimonas sp. MC1895]|uniref:M28 family metallopeptidase n=1 Tax=Luteimonas sp. MC1895 TaxID=2819513 RepID=UPI0018F06AF6|nr:M28 family metallopeptidase [Luteimonas sp. MC1895]MBJ6979875.1 M28 family peptidase [Luteimonas sp. MC1895]